MHRARRLQLQGQPRIWMAGAILTAFPFKPLSRHRRDHAQYDEAVVPGRGALAGGSMLRKSLISRRSRTEPARDGRYPHEDQALGHR
jgi:hypothetical protein